MLVLERECWAVGYEEWQIRLYLPLETVASSTDQARNKLWNIHQDQRRVHLSWRHNTWSETRSLCLLNSFERALPNAASSLCFLQCCTVRCRQRIVMSSWWDGPLPLYILKNFLVLKSALSEIKMVNPTFFWSVLPWCIFILFHLCLYN